MNQTDYITSEFNVEDIPTDVRNGFPYEKVLHTLSLLHSTKSITFNPDELKSNQIAYLRKKAQLTNLGMLKSAKKNGKIYIWLNKI